MKSALVLLGAIGADDACVQAMVSHCSVSARAAQVRHTGRRRASMDGRQGLRGSTPWVHRRDTSALCRHALMLFMLARHIAVLVFRYKLPAGAGGLYFSPMWSPCGADCAVHCPCIDLHWLTAWLHDSCHTGRWTTHRGYKTGTTCCCLPAEL